MDVVKESFDLVKGESVESWRKVEFRKLEKDKVGEILITGKGELFCRKMRSWKKGEFGTLEKVDLERWKR